MHAVDGTVVAGFTPHVPRRRYGSEPERLASSLWEAGLDPDRAEPSPNPIAVEAGMTGVVLTREVLERPLLVRDVRT
ncbi:hypothetical protein CU254_21130 [Amycolatopsis sp. AA4]|uniref:DUF6461 domain-containing protein n=1 Tax=Actinomycetes TaxID=1760 RepID=UPI0001B5607F|nr:MULTISPECIES: DUF6461 domain-containing protein [Actinomycetes]ATY12683.1 hypothetical protein CU254_21130 [Amycolatopsis sp. AA4]EFL08486.1 predicted protein [Streptomyces sp. AA4]